MKNISLSLTINYLYKINPQSIAVIYVKSIAQSSDLSNFFNLNLTLFAIDRF